MKNTGLTATIMAAGLLAGCGSDFDERYNSTDRPIIFGCSGSIQMPIFAPLQLQTSPEQHASTTWYKDTFLSAVPNDALDYLGLPEYRTQSPAFLQERPIEGNVMPYEAYALGFYYVDGDGVLKEMDLYFDRYDTALENNARAGSVRYHYWFWAVAPADAEFIGLRLFDNPTKWRYAKASDLHMDQIEELWYGRQADAFTRVTWKGESFSVAAEDNTPVSSFETSNDARCRAAPYFNSTRDDLSLSGFDPEGSNWERRDERRAMLQEIQSRWEKYKIGRSPAMTVPQYIDGTPTKSEGDDHFIPLVAISADDFLERIEDGQLDDSWDGERWRRPLEVWQEGWGFDGNFNN